LPADSGGLGHRRCPVNQAIQSIPALMGSSMQPRFTRRAPESVLSSRIFSEDHRFRQRLRNKIVFTLNPQVFLPTLTRETRRRASPTPSINLSWTLESNRPYKQQIPNPASSDLILPASTVIDSQQACHGNHQHDHHVD